MLRSLWVAKTGMDAQQANLDSISNNLANVSTTAYKRVRPIFEDLLYQNIRAPGMNEDSASYVPAGLQAGNGARIAATQRINNAGSLVQSQNPLDMAINGNGYFAVSTSNGVAYTRAGNFMRNDKGQIVTASGNVLLGQSSVSSASAGSAGIVIPSKATTVAIGTVTLQAASSIPKASSSQVYTCSANQDNMQHCTMLSTDDMFPWGTVIFMTLLLTTLFTMTIIYAPILISRWFRRRDSPVLMEEEEEE
jgi:flagellar hook-basal body protein